MCGRAVLLALAALGTASSVLVRCWCQVSHLKLSNAAGYGVSSAPEVRTVPTALWTIGWLLSLGNHSATQSLTATHSTLAW